MHDIRTSLVGVLAPLVATDVETTQPGIKQGSVLCDQIVVYRSTCLKSSFKVIHDLYNHYMGCILTDLKGNQAEGCTLNELSCR